MPPLKPREGSHRRASPRRAFVAGVVDSGDAAVEADLGPTLDWQAAADWSWPMAVVNGRPDGVLGRPDGVLEPRAPATREHEVGRPEGLRGAACRCDFIAELIIELI